MADKCTTMTKGSSARRAIEFREALLSGIKPGDVREIIRVLVQRAKKGDIAAAKLVLDRVCGSESLADWPSDNVVRRTEIFEELTSPRSSHGWD
jgi:hypothetical protein